MQPPIRSTEIQRHKQAQVVNTFVDEIIKVNRNAKIVVMGDLNDFEFSETLNILQGNGDEQVLNNQINKLPVNERYSYIYKGSSQVLDHLLVSNAIKDNTDIDVVHVNAEFTENTGRASDHDPVVASIDFNSDNNTSDDNSIYIVHTNDMHGRIEESDNSGMGLAKIASKIKELKDKHPGKILVLDAGDTLHGQTIIQLSQGQAMIELMNQIEYDAMVVGNHDFNYGQDRLVELAEQAEFPILAANVYRDVDSKERLLEPYTIKELDGIKIGIFGLATPETMYKTHPKNVEGLTFADPIQEANAMVQQLQEQECDVIIALSHLGMDQSSEIKSEDVANQVNGIDIILDGHSHTVLANGKKVNETLIAQAGEYAENIGIVELLLEENNSSKAKLFTKEEAAELQEDEKIKTRIDELKSQNEVELSEVIGTTEIVLDGVRENVRTKETNLGNLITDAMVDVSGADVAITNGGGIRDSIDVGDITKGEVIKVLPFGNYVILKEVKGSDIKAAIEYGISSYPEASGKFPQISGMTIKFDPQQNNKIVEIKVDGEVLDESKTYKLATNDFIAAGGDGYEMLGDDAIAGEFSGLDEVLIEYIKKQENQKITENTVKVEGRITVKSNNDKKDDYSDVNNSSNTSDTNNTNNTSNNNNNNNNNNNVDNNKDNQENADDDSEGINDKEVKVNLSDISSHWAEKEIKKLVEKGIVEGYPDKTFKPNNSITRAEFLKLLVKAFDLKGTSTKEFKDMNNHWADEIVKIAVSNKIILGYEDNTFRPNAEITREEMAIMIVKVAKLQGGSKDKNFNDYNKISKWAINEFNIAIENGIITGYPDGTIKPENKLTRAEAVTIITRAIE